MAKPKQARASRQTGRRRCPSGARKRAAAHEDAGKGAFDVSTLYLI